MRNDFFAHEGLEAAASASILIGYSTNGFLIVMYYI